MIQVVIALIFALVCWLVLNRKIGMQTFVLPKPSVVASMTTSPSRIHRLIPMLESVMKQTYPVDRIILNIPPKFDRTGEAYVVPSWMSEKFPKVEINRVDQDYGPITKLLPTLDVVHDGFIWIVDDDQRYEPRELEMLMFHFTSPDRALCMTGLVKTASMGFEEAQKDGKVDVFEAYAGVLVHRSMFDYLFKEYVLKAIAHPVARFCDDLITSVYLTYKGYSIWRVGDSDVNISVHWQKGNVLRYGRQSDALHQMEMGTLDRYRHVILVLDQMIWATYEMGG